MLGSMQDHPLNIPMIVGHAERMHGRKTVTTRTETGVVVTPYREVLERARRLVAALRALGVQDGDRVATFCWNTQQHLEAYVGVPCLGAVLHTLNIRLFDKDLAFIVEHAQDSVVIVDRSLLPLWEKVAAQVSCVRTTIVVADCAGTNPPGALDYEELLAAHAPERHLPDVPERQAAAMCYTSGTTGRPKGVVYSHRSNVLHSLVVLSKDALGVCERDVVLPIVPMFHANAWGLPYACLLAGAELVLPGRHGTPETMCRCLHEHGVTLAAGVPSIWIAAVVGLVVALTRGDLRGWPTFALLALWPSFGGHWLELAFLRGLRPRLASRAAQTAVRVLVWLGGGLLFAACAALTAGALAGRLPEPRPAWLLAGPGFVVVEVVAHGGLWFGGRPSVYDGRG